MAIPVESLIEGKDYIFLEGTHKLLKLFSVDEVLEAEFEYFDENHNSCIGICTASEFAEQVLVDYMHDPAYEGIYPYVFLVDSDTPQQLAQRLNKNITLQGKVQPLKNVIKALINAGFLPAVKDHTKGLYFNGQFIPGRTFGKTGMQFADYLSRQKGWDGVAVTVPDFVIE